jgi:dipeptidase E
MIVYEPPKNSSLEQGLSGISDLEHDAPATNMSLESKRNLLLVSNSTLHGQGYLEHIAPEIKKHFAGCTKVPYALADLDGYTKTAREAFAAIAGVSLEGIHEGKSPADQLEACDGIFIGGGNTFRLLSKLYSNNVIDAIRARVAAGIPYMGTSAGSNVACASIMTTNDMPIMYPPSFDALALANIQINAHYIKPDPNSTHKGETRDQRLKEFHEENDTVVFGLCEGAWLRVTGEKMVLGGINEGRLFVKGQPHEELVNGTDYSQHL